MIIYYNPKVNCYVDLEPGEKGAVSYCSRWSAWASEQKGLSPSTSVWLVPGTYIEE